MALDVKFLTEEIIEQYLEDDGNKPWILGFSGGKDSTMLLQLVWYALRKLKPEQLVRKVHIICNNTLVENPLILEFVEDVLHKIEKAAIEEKMPFTVNQTKPRLEDSFWVNLIGKGYPAPNSVFRWCTERLKISPTTKFILDKINENGEVIILLGTRSDESNNRANSIKKHEIKGNRLRRHVLPNAYVFAAIKDVLTEEVWSYLLVAPAPWGGMELNRKLVTLYRNASGGDCPLITDISTPSCGQSRFGCWVCTVVKKDKSMEGLINIGEEWMEPLLEIRDFLSLTVDRDHPEYNAPKYRMPVRRNGAEGLGPYWPWVRKKVLEQILLAQKEIQETNPNTTLITYQELVAIQVTWFRDHIFDYDIADIYNAIFDKKFVLSDKAAQRLKKEKDILKSACNVDEKHFDLINDLLALQKNKVLLMNKRGLQKDLENRLEQFLDPKKQYDYQTDITD